MINQIMIHGSAGDRLLIPRKLTPQEEIIKQHFGNCLIASNDMEHYCAYDKSRWVRQIFDYAHEPFMDGVDWKTYERFLKEWEPYCLEHAITQKSDITEESAEVGKGDAKANSSTKG